ncbi:MAG: PAS domain S-box protein [Bacteroidota bacterium]
MKFIFEKKAFLFYIISAILLSTVLAIFYLNSQNDISSTKKLIHTQEVISKSNEVLLDVLTIETGFRGYLLSGDISFLEPYNAFKSKADTNLDDLAILIKHSENQEIRMAVLKKALTDRLVLIDKYAADKSPDLLSNTQKKAIIQEGKALTDKIRNTIVAINNEEFGLLKVRKIESENNNQFSGLLFLLLLIFLVVIFIFVVLIINDQKVKHSVLEIHTADQKLVSQYTLSLIEASLDPLVTISITGKIMDMNQALVKITGVEREELTGSDFFDYFTEPQMAREVYEEVFDKGSVADSPLTLRHKDGKLTDVLFNGSIYKDDNGNVQGVVIVARDIAEQKWALDLQNANKKLAFQNREKEHRAAELIIANKELLFQNKEKIKRADELVIADIELDFQNKEKEKREITNKELEALSYSAKLASQYSLSLIEASRDPLVTINTEGKITDMNEATVIITGMLREELIGSDFFNYFTDKQMAREVYQEVFDKGSVADAPLTLRHKAGKLTDVLFNGSVYKDDNGNVMGVVIVARDVTEQKRIEKELVEARVFAELATEIAEEEKRNAQSATLIAENAVKAKQQFLSNMSHEIRTPMNAIIGFTKVVLKTDLTDKQKEYLSAIKMSGDALIVLINDILDLAKVDAGKMTFEQVPFKLSASISAMLHIFETKIQEKNLELITEYDTNIPKVLLGDPVRLHQIILNLVSNAIKFTLKGKITVSVLLLNEDEESVTVEFAISDTGIGIHESKIDTIFDDFQQATSGTSRLYGGTGLGLAIVKQLVEPQGGTVMVKSKIKEGSTFSFILNFPKTNVETEEEIEIIELEKEIKSIKVLVVEDMPLNQLLMKTLLDDFGFERDIAENGQIAIEKLQNEDFDVVLMDLQMPIMNGFDATEYIRNTLNLDIPIIALTADVTTVDLAKCKAVGMNDYIAKPVDERLLYRKIVDIVKNKRISKNTKKSPKRIKIKCTNLDYLNIRTKSNPNLMMEMISIYIQQTPPLIKAMKQSILDKDWDLLAASVHKLIPSFAIMGMDPDLEEICKKIQEAAKTNQFTDETAQMAIQLEMVCIQACEELELEFNLIKNAAL